MQYVNVRVCISELPIVKDLCTAYGKLLIILWMKPLAGVCTQITVTLHTDGSITVEDNGRGIPIGQKNQRQGYRA